MKVSRLAPTIWNGSYTGLRHHDPDMTIHIIGAVSRLSTRRTRSSAVRLTAMTPRAKLKRAVEKSARSIASLRHANSLDRLSVAFGPVRHKRVAWQGLIRHLSRFRHSSHRQVAGIKQADLHKNGSLIPVDMLMRELAVTELHDCDKRHLDLAAGGRHAW